MLEFKNGADSKLGMFTSGYSINLKMAECLHLDSMASECLE
jgi:hypothetical protein